MTLITHISTPKIELVIADSLCGIKNTEPDPKCQKIFINEKLLIAKFGHFSAHINVAFKEFLPDFPEDSDFTRLKDRINFMANKIEATEESNFLLINTKQNPEVFRIKNNKAEELNIEQAGKLNALPDWIFFSPIEKDDGTIDFSYQEQLLKGLYNNLKKIGINKIEDIEEKHIDDLCVNFYSEIYYGQELQKESIKGEYIWVAYSVDKGPWQLKSILPFFPNQDFNDFLKSIG